MDTSRSPSPPAGIRAPLAVPVFRRVWAASLFSNLGQQMLAVTAAWTMVQMRASPGLVAGVQAATMLPVMLLALPGGAIADMYDKRKAAIAALLIAAAGAIYLVLVSLAGLLTPQLLLAGCFIVGCGVALFSPAWQSSVSEQVDRAVLPAAVALYSVSANLARSVGPAIGGILIASTGRSVSFAITTVLYLPIILALLSWRRVAAPPRLPPEGVVRAVRSGLRYVRFSAVIRRLLTRSGIAAFGAAAVYALLPLVARELLASGARTYGILLGAFGVGAVSAIFLVQRSNTLLSPRQAAATYAATMGGAILVMAASRTVSLTAVASFVAGGTWMLTTSLYNVGVQTSTPRWVSGRALASFQAVVAGGLALGAIAWGGLAGEIGVVRALLVAGGLLVVSPLAELVAPMPARPEDGNESIPADNEPDVAMAISGRSGPIAVEVEYLVDESDARRFYDLMQQQQRVLERNGAYEVTLARDLADPKVWLRRSHYPTWHDYLRARDRPTRAERELTADALALLIDNTEPRVRRRLERPFGSVRWTDTTRDAGLGFPPGGI